MSIPLTVIGNLTADPELRTTTGGKQVASFSVASTERVKVNGEWTDGETSFFRVSVWDQYGVNVARSLTKGARVLVAGRLTIGTYKNAEGAERTSLDLVADEVAATLRYATAALTKSAPLAAVAS